MNQLRLQGTFTALVTPFLEGPDKHIDWSCFEKFVEAQVKGGVEGLVPCGTTGESPALTVEEQGELVRRAVAVAAGRALVVAGTGSPSTRGAIALARNAERAGADALMVVVPYYNRPSQDGLVAHFVAVARAVPKPIVIYNVPGRTGSDLLPETLSLICEQAPNVVAVKEATGNVVRAQQIRRLLGDRVTILSGDDGLTLPMIAVGAKGVISVTSNLLPAAVSRATRLALEGRYEDARRAHYALLPIHEAMFCEANPSPVKAALAMEGLMRDLVREPLVPATEAARRLLADALIQYGTEQTP